MNFNDTQAFFKHFKIVKIIQMIVLITFELVFFIIIMLHPSLRNSMYSNPNLFALSAMMWLLMIFSFTCILYDFQKMEKSSVRNYQLSRIAYLDELTGLPNRSSFNQLLTDYTLSGKLSTIGLGIMEISNLKDVNQTLGHDIGDTMIRDFASTLDHVASKYGFVCRNGGNEYLAVIENCSSEKMEDFLHTLERQFQEYNEQDAHTPIEFHYDYVLNSELCKNRFSDIITLAHKKLHNLT